MIWAAVFARRMEFVYLFFTCKNSRLTLRQSTHHLSWDWPWHVLVKIKKSRETSRRALNCFVHSFQNLDKTSAAVVTKKCHLEKLFKADKIPLKNGENVQLALNMMAAE